MPVNKQASLLQYSGLAFQLLLVLGAAVYAGFWVDKWIAFRIPIGIWLLPLLVLIGILVKVVKDTSKK